MTIVGPDLVGESRPNIVSRRLTRGTEVGGRGQESEKSYIIGLTRKNSRFRHVR